MLRIAIHSNFATPCNTSTKCTGPYTVGSFAAGRVQILFTTFVPRIPLIIQKLFTISIFPAYKLLHILYTTTVVWAPARTLAGGPHKTDTKLHTCNMAHQHDEHHRGMVYMRHHDWQHWQHHRGPCRGTAPPPWAMQRHGESTG